MAGAFAKENGDFSIEPLPAGKPLKLKVTFMGYKNLESTFTISPSFPEKDLGNLKLEKDEQMLKTVDITAEKSATEMSIDRKVFNVDKNITTRGGTALDVMKNVPSVTVDDNGNAQIRQSEATVYVDGRPTGLSLNQIASDQIERVEVITNPSAKFEASASGGIINIVLKSNQQAGYNGVMSGGLGTGNRYNGNLLLNLKQKPFNLSINYGTHSMTNDVKGYTDRTSMLNSEPSEYFHTGNNTVSTHTFHRGGVTLDCSLNNRNTLTLEGNITAGDFTNKDNQDFDTRNTDRYILSEGYRITSSVTRFRHFQSAIRYKKTYPKQGKELGAFLNATTMKARNASDFDTRYFFPSDASPELQYNVGNVQARTVTFQLDYTNPLSDSTKLELGVRSAVKPSTQHLDVMSQDDVTRNWKTDTFLTNHYDIVEMINAAYVNYITRWKGFEVMPGIRFESSFFRGILTDKNDRTFQYLYPDRANNIINALFPSFFIGKKLKGNRELQLNVSRKLNRQNFRQLMPFIRYSDKSNYQIGNPNLTPEFLTISELNYRQLFDKGNLLFTVFYRHTQNPLSQITYADPGNPSLFITTFINGNQSHTAGIDNTLKYELFKSFETTFNINAFYTEVDASFGNSTYSNKGFNYTAKLNLNYRLPGGFNFQGSGNYESPRIIPQGTTNEIYFIDMGISKEYKKWLTFTLSVSDLFNTKARGSYLENVGYIQDLYKREEPRFVKLNVMMRFGNSETTFFRKKSREEGEGDF
jgi:hypothetical protein